MYKKSIKFLIRLIQSIFARKKRGILDYKIHPTAIIYDKENVDIDDSALICEHVIIRSPISKLRVGSRTQIGPFSVFFTGETGIIVGNNVMIAPHCVFAGGNHNYKNTEIPMIDAGSYSKGPILIEDDVWIGSNCTICDNVTIGKGAIIAANSVVNRDVKPYDICGGVPAKFISNRLNND